ncbi:MAG: hypothetical protein U9O94_05910 [Nanoarchaeota archaeon]|nr:hypothetical protein [Nanoarchaeota archaeon]
MVDTQRSALGLSDEEFMKQDPADFLEVDTSTDTPEDTDSNEDTSEDNSEDAKEDASDNSEDTSTDDDSEAQEHTTESNEDEDSSQLEGDTQTEQESFSETDKEESLDTSKEDSPDTKKDTSETIEFDYESAYKKVTEPFKANGVEMAVKDPEDIVKLMQMGANYQKKMAQLKPNLKIIKMLDKHKLLDESRLHNLIDLSNKDPNAVAKLLKDSGLDPIDIDTEGVEYTPNNYSISDEEFNIDVVLEDLKDSPTFSRTINTLTKEWDNASKATVSDNPEIIRIIDAHMSNGVFDKVNEVLQREKSLGKLNGISDVNAYEQIANRLTQSGLLAPATKAEPSDVSSKPKPKQKDAERNKQRKAAATSKSSRKSTKPVIKDILNMSDADFEKQFSSR